MSFRSQSWMFGSNVYYAAHIGWIHSDRDRVTPPGRCRRLGRAAALGCCLAALLAWSGFVPAPRPRPTLAYTLQIDSAHTDVLDVAIRFRGLPATFLLAMKRHAEYNAGYWRYIEGMRVDGSGDDDAAGIVRMDSTLWRVTLPGGRGVLRYRLRVQPPADPRRAWQTYVRADGALINPPDVFLYLPTLAGTPVTVKLRFPRSWSARERRSRQRR